MSLQKSVPTYHNPHLFANNQNNFALLGLNPLSSALPYNSDFNKEAPPSLPAFSFPTHPRRLRNECPTSRSLRTSQIVLRLHLKRLLRTNHLVRDPQKERCFLIDMDTRRMITTGIGRIFRLIFRNTAT